MTPYRSGKKTKDGTPYLYYACVDYTKDGSLSTCPVKMLPAREFEALIRQVLADLGNQPAILQACVDAANREAAESVAELEATLARHREELRPLTAGIRRLIEIMKQEDLLAEDIREEYRRLVREKEQLQTRCEKLERDLERRRKRVLDAGLIRRSLQDFERLVGLLPLEDQKELFQLLLREVVVWPFESERETSQEPPAEAAKRTGARTFATKIRTRWYRVRIALYQLPNVPNPASVNHSGKSSGFGVIGSPKWHTRQRRQTAAILSFEPDGRVDVAHVDLADPGRPYAPAVDWQAEFRVELDDVSEALLAPDLQPDFHRIVSGVRAVAPDSGRGTVLRVARRCWSGQQASITRGDLLADLESDPHLSTSVRAQFADLFEGSDTA